jgi:ribosome maturation factor RimP
MQLPPELAEKIESIVTGFGFVIFLTNFFYQGKTRVIRLLIDKPTGGISIKECSDVNRKLNEFLDEEFGPEGDFSVEVSSPGLDWPLREKKDFQRVILKNIRIELKQQEAGKNELSGMLREVRDDSLILDVGNESLEVRFENINRASEQY